METYSLRQRCTSANADDESTGSDTSPSRDVATDGVKAACRRRMNALSLGRHQLVRSVSLVMRARKHCCTNEGVMRPMRRCHVGTHHDDGHVRSQSARRRGSIYVFTIHRDGSGVGGGLGRVVSTSMKEGGRGLRRRGREEEREE